MGGDTTSRGQPSSARVGAPFLTQGWCAASPRSMDGQRSRIHGEAVHCSGPNPRVIENRQRDEVVQMPSHGRLLQPASGRDRGRRVCRILRRVKDVLHRCRADVAARAGRLAQLVSEHPLSGQAHGPDTVVGQWVRVACALVISGRSLIAHNQFNPVQGWGAGFLTARARQAGWTTPLSEALGILSMALLSYEGSVAIHGNGFVSAFVAGACFGAATRSRLGEPTALHQATELTEDVGLYGSFAVWLIFGAVFAGPVLRAGLHWRPMLYAVLSLTIIRMVPVGLALLGFHFRADTVAFIGWFGPRGLASVVFTLLVFEDLNGSPLAASIVEVATSTILLSVVAHGLSSGPLANWYAKRLEGAVSSIPELEETAEVRTRRRSLHDRKLESAAQ